MAEDFEFPAAAEMCSVAIAVRSEKAKAQAEAEARYNANFAKKVESMLDSAIRKAAAAILKAAQADDADVVVYNVCADTGAYDDDGAVDEVSRRLNQFLIDKGYKTLIDSDTDWGESNIKVILID